MMDILKVLFLFAAVAAVTIIQVRNHIRKKEVKESILYIALMSVVVVMYAVVTLNGKMRFNPISILQIPFENIGKYLLMQ